MIQPEITEGDAWTMTGVRNGVETVTMPLDQYHRNISKEFQAGLKKAAEIAQDAGAKFQFGTAGKSVDWYVGVADVMNLVNNILAEEIISEDYSLSSGSS